MLGFDNFNLILSTASGKDITLHDTVGNIIQDFPTDGIIVLLRIRV
jgi:hypothetical protein